MSGILDALRGINGGFEVQRVLGATGTLVYVVTGPVFMALDVIKDVSLTEFALAYPTGLAACIGATAGAIALKDKAVASARVTEQTGAIPTAPPEGPRVPVDMQEQK